MSVFFFRESPESAQHCCCGKQFNLSVSPSQPLLSTQSAQPVRPLEKQPQGLSPRLYKAASSGPGAAPPGARLHKHSAHDRHEGIGERPALPRVSRTQGSYRRPEGSGNKGDSSSVSGAGDNTLLPSQPRPRPLPRRRLAEESRGGRGGTENPPHSVYLPGPLYRYSVVPSLRGRPGLGLRNRLSRAPGI